MLLSLLCVVIVGGTKVYAATEYEIDQKFTSVSELDGQLVAIVNETDAKAIYNINNQNLAYDTYANAVAGTAYLWKIHSLAGEADSVVQSCYALEAVKADGSSIVLWGNSPIYLNSGAAGGFDGCFILGNGSQYGTDCLYGGAWIIEYDADKGFALKNLARGGYFAGMNPAPIGTDPIYWTFCTLKEKEINDSLPAGEGNPTVVVEDSVLLAEAKALAADLDAVAVGKLLAAIEAAEQTGDESKLQTAVDQFKADNADMEKDETAKVATDGWKKFEGNDAAGVCAAQFAPAITTYDGRTANLAESYETTVATTGQIIYQKITGLANGSYKVGFYGNAFYTSGRGFESTMEDGADDVAYVFANDQKEFITARVATSTTENNFRQFDVEVTDGTIKLGMGKEMPGTNWHTMQIYQLTWFTTAKAVYAAVKEDLISAIAVAKTLAADVNKTVGKEAFDAALADAEAALASNMLNIAELEAEVAKMNEAIEVFKKVNTFIDLAEGAYYVIDAESGKMMAAGHDWGTRGIVNEIGLDLNIAINTEKRMVTFDSQVFNKDSHFLGSNLYMDSPAAEWALEYQGFGFYITNGTQYINIDADDNLVLSNTPREWIIVSTEGVLTQRLEEMAKATVENPVDATFLIQGANFNRNDQRNDAWTVSEDCSNKKLSDGNNTNNCAESYHSTFTISQTLNNAPKGLYKMTAQGFYRQDEGLEEAVPVFFIGDKTAEIPAKTGEENSMSDASGSFTNGLYTIDAIEYEFDGEELTIGVKNETAENQWIIFDNFRLTYYGITPLMTAKEDLKAAIAEAKAIETTDMQGADAMATAITDAETALNTAEATVETIAAAKEALAQAISVFNKANLDADLVEIAQNQGKDLDTNPRATFAEGEGYNTYTATEDLSVAFKMFDIDVKDCDYVVVKFAEPVAAGWNLAFWGKNDLSTVAVPAGATEFKYVFADDEKCAIANDVLPQICMLTLSGAQKPLVAKVEGIYKHQVPVEITHTWDFTKWSEETVANLKAEAAKGTTEGLWSDIENTDPEKNKTGEISPNNCFWQVGTSAIEGEELTANEQPIVELQGLLFKNNKARSLAIAVNYGDCTSANGEGFGPYNGPSYLWLGSKNIEYFTIKNVKGGTTIKMGVESHNLTKARGVKLSIDGTELTDSEGQAVAVPTTYADQTWNVGGEADNVYDVVVTNTDGCHIYYIDAEIGEAPKPVVPDDPEIEVAEGWRSVIENGNLASDNVENFFIKENGGDPVPATIVAGAGKNGSRGIVINTNDNPSADWDAQFFIQANENIPAGYKIHVEFDYMATQEAAFDTQSHAEPGNYIHWYCIDSYTANTEWQHMSKEVEVSAATQDTNGNWNGEWGKACDASEGGKPFKTIGFNLSKVKTATVFHFDNIAFWVSDVPTGIQTVKNEKNVERIYNLNGQKMNKAQKGLYIINGKKVVVK